MIEDDSNIQKKNLITKKWKGVDTVMLKNYRVRRPTLIVLVISLVLSFTTSSFSFATNNDALEYTEKYIVNGENFNISFSQDGSIRTAVVYENDGKTVTILQIDEETGIMTYNGVSIHEEVVHNKVLSESNSLLLSNWTEPQESIISLALGAYTIGALVGYLQLKFGMMSDEASYIAGLIIGDSGFLYVKSITQYNYVDYAPKVGYRLTESLHLKSDASDRSLYTRTMTGSR